METEEKKQFPENPEEVQEKPDYGKGGEKVLLIAIVGIIIITLLIVGIGKFGKDNGEVTLAELMDSTIAGHETADNFMYNGFAFVRLNDMWLTDWVKDGQKYRIPLRFSPRDVEEVEITGDLDERFREDNIYITFDPRTEPATYIALGAAELSVNLATALDTVATAACIVNETDACVGRPIVDCNSEDKGVIYMREATETRVILDGNCMILQGPEIDLLKAIDRVLYIWYGIMPRNLDS